MLKLLIVEDERWEREGLFDFLDWKELGIEIVGAASDGIEGYEMALALDPDIVITDIRMPGMDGLDMSRKLKAVKPEIKLIILTGYSDFEYAREALQLQASEYVLKPVEELELLRAVGKVLDVCKQEQLALQETEVLRAEVKDHRRIVMVKRAVDLLDGRLSEEQVKEIGAMAGFTSVNKEYFVLAIPGREGLTEDSIKEALVRAHIMAFISSQIPESWFIVLSTEGMEPHIIVGTCAARLRKALSISQSEPFPIAVGNQVSRLQEVSGSYQSAKSAMEFGWFCGITGIVGPEYMERKKLEYASGIGDFIHKVNHLEKQLTYSVNALDEASATAALTELFQEFERLLFVDREFVLRLMTGVFHELELLSGAVEHRNPEELEPERSLQDLMTLQEVKAYSASYLQQILSWMQAKREGKDEYIIQKVNRIIDSQYGSNDISLTSVADEVFLSPNYLGALYKKATGRTFLEALTQLRMDKAKELLASSDYKVARVAAEVGMPNSSYFGTVFKNRFGLTPGEYQEMIHRK